MSKAQVDTLLQLLEQAGHRLVPFDMGRRIGELPRPQFLDFERCQTPYPYPLQRQAWLALLFQPPDPGQEPFIWFLRLPLDEQGKLLLAARDDFLQRLLERLGEQLQHAKQAQQLQQAVEEGPYSFKPRDERLALLHALLSRRLQRPASAHYTAAQHYFSGESGWDQWTLLGYQGIADIAVRWGLDNNEIRLANAIPQLPERPFVALCNALESMSPGPRLTEALTRRVEQELQRQAPATPLLAAAAQAVGGSAPTLRDPLIDHLLASPHSRSAALLGAIAARAWEALSQPKRAALFLHRLADNSDGQPFFDHCLTDLLFVPGLRQPLLQALRSPDRPAVLSTAVGSFFATLNRP